VDELDRMNREELMMLLKAIRGVVDLPNLTYVCAFDKKALARLVNENDPDYGALYLQKFFPVQSALPRIDRELIGILFDRHVEALCKSLGLLSGEKEKKAFSEAISRLWYDSIRPAVGNFRRMALFFNSLRMSLADIAAEVNLFDMLILQVVRMLSEETFEFIYDNGRLFYEPSWNIRNWEERLSVDDKEETNIRSKRFQEFFPSLSAAVRVQVEPLLGALFPSVRKWSGGNRFWKGATDEGQADREKRICHPDYFPCYFVQQVPDGRFGEEEMSKFVVALNAESSLARLGERFEEMMVKLSKNPWKRLDFLRNLVFAAEGLGDPQCESLVLAVAAVSDSLERDILGMGEWGRARALLLVAAKHFSGTSKLQELLVAAITGATSDLFAAEILSFSSSAREQNKIITDWTNVSIEALRGAFAERMRGRYEPGSALDFPYKRLEGTQPFFVWANIGADQQTWIADFFRHRFQRAPAEQGNFVGWLLPKGSVYTGDPLDAVNKLFPVHELYESLKQVPIETWHEMDRVPVERFIEMMEAREERPQPAAGGD
jgi:hypothetical protein